MIGALTRFRFGIIYAVPLAAVTVLLCGCASIMHQATSRFANNLTAAILAQDDPATVKDGVPAYLLLIDGMISGDPTNVELLLTGAKLYGAYASGFVDEPQRSQRLAQRAYDYARRAACLKLAGFCAKLDGPFAAFEVELAKVNTIDALYGLAAAWAGKIEANTADWNAIADIPKVQAALERVIALDPNYDSGNPQLYLGVLNSIRPASLGGKPEDGKQYFDKAIAISDGKNLMASVLYAQYYARLVFDQNLHDRLLKAVLNADPAAPRLTLINVLAQRRAKLLLASGKDFF